MKQARHLISLSHFVLLSAIRDLIINKNFLPKPIWNHGKRNNLDALEQQELQNFDTEYEITSLEPTTYMDSLSWRTPSEAHTSHDVPGKS